MDSFSDICMVIPATSLPIEVITFAGMASGKMLIWERHGNNYKLTSGYHDLIRQFGRKRPVLLLWCAKGEIRVHQEGTERMHFSEVPLWEYSSILDGDLSAMLEEVEGGRKITGGSGKSWKNKKSVV